MELAHLADGGFHVIGLDAIGIIEEREVDLDGCRCCRREIIVLEDAQDGLGTGDQDVSVAGNVARSPQEVGEIFASDMAECSRSQCSRKERSDRRRSMTERTPAKGLF